MENEIIAVSSSDIRTFKTKWKKRFQTVTYSDELTKEENDLFKNDSTMIRLIEKWKRAELAVIQHMDSKIELSRSG